MIRTSCRFSPSIQFIETAVWGWNTNFCNTRTLLGLWSMFVAVEVRHDCGILWDYHQQYLRVSENGVYHQKIAIALWIGNKCWLPSHNQTRQWRTKKKCSEDFPVFNHHIIGNFPLPLLITEGYFYTYLFKLGFAHLCGDRDHDRSKTCCPLRQWEWTTHLWRTISTNMCG